MRKRFFAILCLAILAGAVGGYTVATAERAKEPLSFSEWARSLTLEEVDDAGVSRFYGESCHGYRFTEKETAALVVLFQKMGSDCFTRAGGRQNMGLAEYNLSLLRNDVRFVFQYFPDYPNRVEVGFEETDLDSYPDGVHIYSGDFIAMLLDRSAQAEGEVPCQVTVRLFHFGKEVKTQIYQDNETLLFALKQMAYGQRTDRTPEAEFDPLGETNCLEIQLLSHGERDYEYRYYLYTRGIGKQQGNEWVLENPGVYVCTLDEPYACQLMELLRGFD